MSAINTARARWGPAVGASVIVCAALAVGLYVQFGPMIRSGLGLMQTDLGDTRLNNYILEHDYRWITGSPEHRSLWSPPVFYPESNTGAYSDILLGVAPLYWVWRAVGVAPDTAFQLWLLLLATINYVVALVCCRKVLGVGWTASAIGAFVFAFGSPRLAQTRHEQLIAQFYPLLGCYALVRVFRIPDDPVEAVQATARRPVWLAMFAASVVAQFYTGYYQAWFFVLAVGIGLAWSLALPGTRPAVLRVGRASGVAAVAMIGGALLALVPLARPYLRAASDVGVRSFSLVTWYLPRIWSWVFMGRESRYYSWMYRFHAFRSIAEGHEHRLGLGFVTTCVALAGLWLGRRRPIVRVVGAVGVTIVLLSTMWPGGFSLWGVVYALVPGAVAIRGVSRIALVLLIPAGVGVALVAERFRRWVIPVLVGACVIVLEQQQRFGSYDKVDGRRRVALVAQAIPRRCEAFLYTPSVGHNGSSVYHVDAMWASMITGVPTVNGYSGNVPPGWPFAWIVVANPAHDSVLTADLLQWAHRESLDPTRVCRVSTPAPD